jgi:hypothetical protein
MDLHSIALVQVAPRLKSKIQQKDYLVVSLVWYQENSTGICSDLKFT